MSTKELFHHEYSALMRYNHSALVEIAFESYGLSMAGASKEDIALACANIEVTNYVR